MNQVSSPFRIALLVILLASLAAAQNTSASRLVCENARLDMNAPPVILTFDRSEVLKQSNNKSERVYWIKIRNNTKCEIEIETSQIMPLYSQLFARDENGQFIRNSRGGLLLKKDYEKDHSPQKSFIPNGSNAPVVYYLYDSKKKSIGSGNLDGCLVYASVIRSNNSVFFPVSPWRFQKGHYFEVPFQYSGNDLHVSESQLKSRMRFAFNDLPAEAQSKPIKNR